MPAIDLQLTGPQSRAYRLIQLQTTTTLLWGRGTGKSYFLRLMMWLKLAEYRGRLRRGANGETFRGIRIAWVMPTLKAFRDVHEAALIAENAGRWAWMGGRLNRSTLSLEFPDGSWVKPVPAKDHTANSGRGLRVDMVLGDEIDDVGLSVWDAVVEPWFTEPWSLGIRLVGGTPRRGRHGQLYRLYRLGTTGAEGYHAVKATFHDSPETVDPRQAARAKLQTAPAVYAREWLADPDSAEGLVYPFDEAFHVRPPPDGLQFSQLAVGVDHGWTHPGAFLLLGVSGYGEDATAWVLEEEYASERSNSEWDKIARDWSEKWGHPTFFCDPARADRLHDLRTRGNSRVEEADNSVQPGIARVADRLAIVPDESGGRSAHLYVHPRCKNLIREFGMYKRKPDPLVPDQYLDDVIKRNDDACDALRYGIMGIFGKRTGYSSRHEADSY